MGSTDKLLEPVGGQPLIRQQAWRALKASREVTVLIRPGRPALKRALAGLQIRLLVVSEAFEGMGGSLRAGTRAHLRSRAFMMLLADLVEIEASDLRAVIAARDRETGPWVWCGATEDGKAGHPVIFESHIYGELLNLRGDNGGRAVIDRNKERVRLVTLPGQRARRDLDTPEDWAAWRAETADPT